MPSLKDIRKRISSVKNTQQITKAMKMVAASKLRRAQERITSFSAYADKANEMVRGLASQIDPQEHPLLRTPEAEKKVLLISISSDRGLCGGFNANAFKRTRSFLEEKAEAGIEVDVITVGRKINDLLKRRNVNIIEYHTGIFESPDFTTIAPVSDKAMDAFLAGDYDGVYVIYNHFVTAITQEVRCEQVLPLSTGGGEIVEETAEGLRFIEYVYEPGRHQILDKLLPQSVRLHIYRALLDSIAGEQGARMSAMDSASSNAKKAIERLTLQYNRARQAAITKELMEIVSGAEALK